MEWENGEGGKGGATVNKRIKNLTANKNTVVDYWTLGTKERLLDSISFFHVLCELTTGWWSCRFRTQESGCQVKLKKASLPWLESD